MDTFCQWVIAKEYYDGPMSGIALRSHDQAEIFFKVVGWDTEQWQRIFAIAPIQHQTSQYLLAALEVLEPRKEPFWFPGSATNKPEVSDAWLAVLADAKRSTTWTLVRSHDLFEVAVSEMSLSSEQRTEVSFLIEKDTVKDIAGDETLQTFVDGLRGAD